ncbi:MAG: prepilin-type N-terminal cleavage/methylation domain-containing protein [Pseudomonadota bacterium]
MKVQQNGFTLMEMIGVVAVIAILAAMATPMIFDAIEKSRVAAFAQNINTIRTAVFQFYEDTGRFPLHVPSDNGTDRRQLTRDTNAGIPGWDGPYIETEFKHPFVPNGYVAVNQLTDINYQFDLDGDGSVDTTNVIYVSVQSLSTAQGLALNNQFDDDGEITSGAGRWDAAGRVKRQGAGSSNPTWFIIYLGAAN